MASSLDALGDTIYFTFFGDPSDYARLEGFPSYTYHTSTLSNRWLWISIVVSLVSFLGNLDRKRWLYALTAVAISPLAYRILWPLYIGYEPQFRELCNGYRHELHELYGEYWDLLHGLCSVSRYLLLGLYIVFRSLLDGLKGNAFSFLELTQLVAEVVLACYGKLSTMLAPVRPQLSVLISAPLQEELAEQVAEHPRSPLRVRPPRERVERSLPPSHSAPRTEYESILAYEKHMRHKSWGQRRTLGKKDYSKMWRINVSGRREGFDDDYDITPGFDVDPTQVPLLETPEWERIVSGPRTPVSAAKLEGFVALKGPGSKVLEVQVMKTCAITSNWLCKRDGDKDEQWQKVRETILDWWETCNRLRTKRIAGLEIGISEETTGFVLGAMHLSMYDILECLELQFHDQTKFGAPSQSLEQFGRQYAAALQSVTVELAGMANDYPENPTVCTMARLAAKTNRIVDRWKKDLEFFATGASIPNGHQDSETTGHQTSGKAGTMEALAIIEDWLHICKMWETTSKDRFTDMVRQQYTRPTSSLDRMARQMSELKSFLSKTSELAVPDVYQDKLVFAASVMKKKCKQLGELAEVSRFYFLTTAIRQCEQAMLQKNSKPQDRGSAGPTEGKKPETKAEPGQDRATKRMEPKPEGIKQEFLAKLERLGKEARQKEYGIGEAEAIARNADLETDPRNSRAGRHLPGTQEESVQIFGKVYKERTKAWEDLFPETFAKRWTEGLPPAFDLSDWSEARKKQATESLERTEDFEDRPHAVKRKIGRDEVSIGIADEAPAEEERPGVMPEKKRFYRDTHLKNEEPEPVQREKVKEVSNSRTKRAQALKEAQDIEAGRMSRFDLFVAQNRQAMQQKQQGDTKMLKNLDAREMDQNLAAANGEDVELVYLLEKDRKPFLAQPQLGGSEWKPPEPLVPPPDASGEEKDAANLLAPAPEKPAGAQPPQDSKVPQKPTETPQPPRPEPLADSKTTDPPREIATPPQPPPYRQPIVEDAEDSDEEL